MKLFGLQITRSRPNPLHRLVESVYDALDGLVNPNDEFEGWLRMGTERLGPRGAANSMALDEMRAISRHLAFVNGFALNFYENLVSYTVGTGMTFTAAVPEAGIEGLEEEAARELIRLVEEVWTEFAEANNWTELEADFVVRAHRDGDAALRLFGAIEQDGPLNVRAVDAGSIAPDPQGRHPWGIITAPNDEQRVVAYLIDGNEVPASDVVFRKLNVDFDVLRGVPTLHPVREQLVRAAKLLRNMGKLGEVQSAIAIVREHAFAPPSGGLAAMLDKQADKTVTDFASGRTVRQKKIPEGAIVDVAPGTKLHFPVAATAIEGLVKALQAELRSIAARVQFPEFMFTSDASNANYSSTLVSEGPAVKRFEREQARFGACFRRVHRRVIEHAVVIGKLPEQALQLKSVVTGPTVASRNALDEARTREIENRAGVLSPQTWSRLSGLDYETEQKQRVEHDDKFGSLGVPLSPEIGADGKPVNPGPNDPAGAEPKKGDASNGGGA